MPITTLDQWVAAAKQNITLSKTATRTTIAAVPFSMFELAGNPGAGVLAGTSTTTGVVPDDATAGCPTIFTFGGGNTGYLSTVQASNSVASTLFLYDVLWKGGAYAFNAATTGQTPTSFLSRIPGGTAANTAGQTEIWVEQVTAATGNQAVSVTYNDETGTSRSTGAVGIGAAPTVGRMWQLPLAAGTRGVSGVTGVAGTVATAGTFNVLVLRRLWQGRISVANAQITDGIFSSNNTLVFDTSALFLIVQPDGTSSGLPSLQLTIANG